MEKLRKIIAELREFQQNRDEYIEQAIRDNEEAILRLNVEDQLYARGINASGGRITPPYSARTIRYKKKHNQITSHVTLRDTGAFHKAFFIAYQPGGFSIGSSDEKAEGLSKTYQGIFGLTQENKDFISEEYVRKIIEQKLKNILNG